MSNEISKAMGILSQAMKEDYGYAYTWYSNIAVSAEDAGADRETAREGAVRFMKTSFGIDITVPPTQQKDEEPEASDRPTFMTALEKLINDYSIENGSNTPDFILAEYIAGCLTVFADALRDRDEWYNFSAKQ